MGSAIGGGKNTQESSTQVDIPDFLRPFLQQGAGVAGGALSQAQQLAGGDVVAPFTQDQLQGFQQGRDVAGGAGGFLPTAQNQFLQTAQGRGLQDVLGPEAFQALSSFAGGRGLDQFIPQQALNTLTQAGQIPQEAENALRATAGGDFLFGGQGFDQAVQAAQRSATPGIISGFGGRAGSGLARHAVEQSAIDAFAKQFGAERGNQLGASQFLSNRGTGAAAALGQFGSQEAQRGLGAGQFLGGAAGAERNRALNAAGQLPGIGLAGSNILQNIGSQIQQQNQFGIDAPRQAQFQLLQAALQGLPISALLGQSTQGEGTHFGFGFGND